MGGRQKGVKHKALKLNQRFAFLAHIHVPDNGEICAVFSFFVFADLQSCSVPCHTLPPFRRNMAGVEICLQARIHFSRVILSRRIAS